MSALQHINRAALPMLGLAAPLALPFAWWHSPAFGLGALGACAAAHGALAYATLRPNNSVFGPVVTHFVPAAEQNQVWLTIDDGPDPHDTPRILDLLDEHEGARATFFVRGDRARAHPELIREIVRRGHALGNHTLNHLQTAFWCLGPRRLACEIGGCNAVIAEITGAVPPFFRAPVGHINPFVFRVIEEGGQRAIGWSARGFDGVDRHAAQPTTVVARILEGLCSGAIILLHEGRRGPNGEAVNLVSLRGLLDELNAREYRAILPDPALLR